MPLSQNRIAKLIRESGLSQTALAKRSGVSRVQISRIVNGNVETIQPRTLKKLASALGVAQRELTDTGAVAYYRQIVEDQLGMKSFSGLALLDLPEQSLDAIFVSLLAVRQGARLDDCDADRLAANVARDSFEEAAHESNALAIERLMIGNPLLIMLGCPGAGKTTVLQNTAVKTARGELFGENCLPVFVRLPEFAAALEISPSTDFVSWIIARAEQSGCRGFGEELGQWLKSEDKSILFLLDGLDEVANETDRRRLVDHSLAFVRRYPANRFCITSRPVGFDEIPWRAAGFEVIRLIEFGDDQINEAIKKWSEVLARRTSESAETVGLNLSFAIRENPRVRQIAANPLILTILVFLCQSRGYSLPRRRVDLYFKVAEVFLDSWESSKRQTSAFSETLNIDLDTRELSWLISDVALEMQRRGLVLAKRWWIEQRIEETLSARIGLDNDMAKDATGRILRFISDRTGLLEERALDLYAFSHRTLQEYFAAVGAVNEADAAGSRTLPKLILPHLFHPDWVEVVRLIASQVTPPRAEELMRVILDDPDPSGRFLHRGPLLAARCLLDGATIANRRVVEQVFRSFNDLGRSNWVGMTLEALSLLRQFKPTRYNRHATLAIDRILEEARRNLDDEEYESLIFAAKAADLDVQVRGTCGKDKDQSAVVELHVEANEVQQQVYVPNFDLISEDQEAWHEHAVAIVEDAQVPIDAKHVVLTQMGLLARLRHTKTHRRSRVRLKFIVRRSDDPHLRAAAAYALRECLTGRLNAKRLLLGVLKSGDEDPSVRAAAAYALSDVAANDLQVQQVLRDCLDHASHEEIQVAAARSLREAAVKNESVATVLLNRACDQESNSARLQAACVRGLEGLIKDRSDIQDCYRQWALGDNARTRIACQVLAKTFAQGDVLAWDAALVRRIEEVLRSIGQPDNNFGPPCPHALWALEALVEARQSHCGLRVESVLADCLEGFSQQLQWAFIFGSVARNAQSDCSDVDLMLIGDVTMRDVSSCVKQAEHALGRDVNPAIYSRQSLAERLHTGDPFLIDVMRGPKIPIPFGDRHLSVEELDDELRAVEAERLAPS